MKKTLLTLSVLGMLFILPNNSFAWGRKGHSIVAQIAFHYLDDQTKANVLKYLNGMSIEDAASWMDDMRSDHAYDYMKPYHYLDADKGQKLQEISSGNIVTALNSAIGSFSNFDTLSFESVQQKLFFIFHLTGDLHQPLHVGYADDKGGNKVQVSFFGKGSNIHSVWDTEIIEYKNITMNDCLQQNHFTAEEIKKIQEINVLEWGNESRKYLEAAYSFKGNKIEEDYVTAQVPVIEKQLLLAGLRLASVLQHCFGSLNLHNVVVPEIKRDTPLVDIKDVEKYEGKIIKVCAKIYGTKFLENTGSQPTFLNAGAPYPNSPLTFVIRNSDRINFSHKPEDYYNNKEVCVTGKLILFKEKPEIVISREDQITLQ